MPRNEADRVAAERATAHRQRSWRTKGTGRASEREELDALRNRVEGAIKGFLEERARQNYEGIEEVAAYVPSRGLARFFGKRHLVKLGGYHIISAFKPPDPTPLPIYVLSNERFLVGRNSYSPAEFASLVEKHEGLSNVGGHYPRSEPWTLEVFRALVSYLEDWPDRDA